MKESSQTFGKFVIDKGKGQRVGGDGGGAGVSGRGDVGGRVRPNVNFRIKQRYREEIVFFFFYSAQESKVPKKNLLFLGKKKNKNILLLLFFSR